MEARVFVFTKYYLLAVCKFLAQSKLFLTLSHTSCRCLVVISNHHDWNGCLVGTSVLENYIIKYKRVIASTKEFVPFVIETQGRWGFHEIFKSIYAKIPVKGSRVSRNYWQQQISLAYMKATLANIVHKFHIARKNVFGPLAPQELYYFESFYGQI